jgi:hypothetical protein
MLGSLSAAVLAVWALAAGEAPLAIRLEAPHGEIRIDLRLELTTDGIRVAYARRADGHGSKTERVLGAKGREKILELWGAPRLTLEGWPDEESCPSVPRWTLTQAGTSHVVCTDSDRVRRLRQLLGFVQTVL